ncbi:YqaA family protein [Methylomicrobium lacus]|uniref:YqaA family protein n=1 Tax=Methylomicrobium lacus TaxID=136992 RepID=UPI0035A929B2
MTEAWLEIGGLFVSAFVSSTIAPGGSEAVLAYLIAEGRHPALQLVGVATLGNTLGAMTTWGLGLLAAKRYPAAALLPAKSQRALELVQKRGVWALFFSWLPVIGDALCFAGGWLKLPLLSGVLIILLGKLGRYGAIAWVFD